MKWTEKFRDAALKWRGMRASKRFRSFVQYLVFVGVASLFWVVLALNDNVVHTFDMALAIENVPDSVKFISDPPAKFHITVRDKGTNLLRNGLLSKPRIMFNFRDFAQDGKFRVSRTEFNATLKTLLGPSAQISSVSLDSLSLNYAVGKGKRVPIVVCTDVTAAPGYVISDTPEPKQRFVVVYGAPAMLDTITRVYTEKFIKRNLSETETDEVAFRKIRGAKIEPSKVEVIIPVEPLVKKESMITIKIENVPPGESLLLFPNRVRVVYYVPMSIFNSDVAPMDVAVDWLDTKRVKGDKLPLRIQEFYEYVENPQMMLDSVEFSVMKN